ncbi:MAG: protein phosphatase 2C domain-containing protein [Clostridiales bacterium]|nr:protein phosphatase 2C domain-containing protein [Clostridiales bacterium]
MKKILQSKLNNVDYTLLGCSVKGAEKELNQDAFIIYGDDSHIICLVADGLGSAINAEIGSKAICKVAKELILDDGITDNFPNVLKRKWAEELDVNPNSCDTTFKFIVVDKDEIVFGGIGDGWIIGIVDGRFFEHRNANNFSNQTESILSVGYEDRFQVVKLPYKQIQILSLATDGFSEDIESAKVEEFITQCLSELNNGEETFLNHLGTMMANWPIKTNQDDKTIIICGRNK